MATITDLSRECRTVRVTGELDLLTAPGLAIELAKARRGTQPPYVVVDLSDLTFMDCSALGPLCEARTACLERGGWLRVVYTRRGIGLLLRAVGLTADFPRYATVEAARLGWYSAVPR
ncbi:anti-sigma factor antagonist [Streptomyces melanogenes]|uniref:Anti-sigma factor antagonist n=1 Tax=Streptomyces melanogenes TaxID=67326 RepID=A0ABZ1XD29_9ACTN|nr:anti-sigma factor antagonist [Streptomyces melanogenes]